ncbi:uncharacterized protein SKDI_02G1230 [Saccharomyces kudriavzevii IFO 1802]|uniref:Uncharacterized protein n=1 Tax=Saccharomyces kudriavzevii (strain ATCC MYA-4449 / AS 2.2408 / CBS 8840 / NBRC 1802 / NCYC 2889) TaxID=226230 RepID=A0AA35JBS4_SACK1|nr:uncharacterized protein SKDI_02G1230 [Saccharomyces kudriavzevii IFO 1802]CAI4055207.1 hypothetical protein SKDI_02G1230 [Saccharomyces kudriavzevii IFO 1802]
MIITAEPPAKRVSTPVLPTHHLRPLSRIKRRSVDTHLNNSSSSSSSSTTRGSNILDTTTSKVTTNRAIISKVTISKVTISRDTTNKTINNPSTSSNSPLRRVMKAVLLRVWLRYAYVVPWICYSKGKNAKKHKNWQKNNISLSVLFGPPLPFFLLFNNFFFFFFFFLLQRG